MDMMSGARLGPYEIVAPLGAGGMGEVYRGRDTRLERQVAIKVLAPYVSGDSDFKLRFEREARVISALNHPHICTVHDVGESDGRGYLVMELCEGESLADRLVKGPLPVEQILQYGVQIADALDRAHRSGIVHRDLKPANVMLTRSGAKLLDFGLAKSSVQAPGGSIFDDATHQKPLTAEGSIVGTFQYMAPEQFEGQEADPRSDIFAFGCILYEMATGKRAFEGKTKASLIASILEREPPPVSDVQPLTPPALQRVIKTALAKDPDERWQSAHDLLLELRWISEAGSQAGVAAPVIIRRKQRERLAWALAVVAGLTAITTGGLLTRDYLRPAESLALNVMPNSGTEFALAGPSSGSLTISPNGRMVTFSARAEGGKRLLWVREIDSPRARALAGTEDGEFPFWSPDSRFLAFFADGKLRKINVAGGPPQAIAPVGINPRSGGWNADGVIIFSPTSLSPIHKVSASGGAITAVTTLVEGETTHRWATFLPDGKHFLFFGGSHAAIADSESNAIYVGSLDGMKPKLLVRARSNAAYASGHLLYVRDRVLLAHALDVKALELRGDPIPLAESLQYDSGFFRASFAASAGGSLVYRTGLPNTETQLVWLDRNGRKIGDLGAPAIWNDGRLSPDGRSFVGQIIDPSTGITGLWMYDVERNVGSRFSFGPLSDFAPIWSPDGSHIVFSAVNKDAFDLFIKPASGSGTAELLWASAGRKQATDWSPDRRYLAFAEFDRVTQRSSMYILPMDGEKKPYPFMQSNYAQTGLRFSPDGKWALYMSNESGKGEIYVAPFPGPGGKWQVSSGGGDSATWHKGGREIIYRSTDAMLAVDFAPQGSSVKIGAPKVLFADPALADGCEVTRDGERFLVARSLGPQQQDPITLVTNWTARLEKNRVD